VEGCRLRTWPIIYTVAYFGMKHDYTVSNVLEAGPTPEVAALSQPAVATICTNKHSPMAGTRSCGELLAGGAVCQRMKRSYSSSTFVAATLRCSQLIHADNSHYATFLLDPIIFETTTQVAICRHLISYRIRGVFVVHAYTQGLTECKKTVLMRFASALPPYERHP
jgi:hypothetical protein